jgi:hypothetical protein
VLTFAATSSSGLISQIIGVFPNNAITKWRPEEIEKSKAKDIIELLEKGLYDLKSRPEYFEQFNSPNGWGMYEHFVPFVEKYLEACKEYPETDIYVSR